MSIIFQFRQLLIACASGAASGTSLRKKIASYLAEDEAGVREKAQQKQMMPSNKLQKKLGCNILASGPNSDFTTSCCFGTSVGQLCDENILKGLAIDDD